MKKPVHIIIILIIFLINFHIAAAEAPSINEGSSILIDSKTGQVLYEKNSDAKGLFPASTTKIMTAIIALEKGKLDSMMTASQEAIDDIGKDGSNIGIMAGEQLSLENLLKAMLISSANETANIIAENISATRQEFVDLMNQKAKELGASNTNFVNPCGAHDSNHYTTAADLAKITQYAMTFPKFREIVRMDSYQLPPTNKHDSWPVLTTTNKLMQSDKSENYTIIGVKTGYTGPAGHNLVSAAVNLDGMELISVVMNIKNEGSQANVKRYSKDLLDYGFNNFSLVTLKADSQVFRSVPVEDAADENPLDLLTRGEVKYIMPNDKSQWNVKEIIEVRDPIVAPVNKGDIMGHIEYQLNGAVIGKVDLLAARQVEIKPQVKLMNSFEAFLENRILQSILLTIFILSIALIILRLVLRTISRRVNARNVKPDFRRKCAGERKLPK
ncbi:MAG: D-alanyl-D-alanine carboxypeptidase [Ruminiclostridium sp.]|nr:D-alanyl-D-alanine carboxypeptidase [Ruminiclostridium sp.]